ncbi:hypothetical protein [Bacillus marinisedimentorum]|uniref:hypothetical protein n=1 Tax=Bacillus marinisedimentorum TaxID=1821260 RepID=UPI0007DF61D7|nr:hypothetical protein [Bacillus marinisedimentorum]
MFNLFNTTNDVKYLIEQAGQEVLINGTKQKALITTPAIGEHEDRYIHTLQAVYMGDLVDYKGFNYLTITETQTLNIGKYKALMRYCNHEIVVPGEVEQVQTGTDPYGKPIYETIEGEPIHISVVVDNKSFAVDTDNAINVAENEIVAVLQDNEVNRGKLAVNNEFDLLNGTWKVQHHDLTKRGLLILTCAKVV